MARNDSVRFNVKAQNQTRSAFASVERSLKRIDRTLVAAGRAGKAFVAAVAGSAALRGIDRMLQSVSDLANTSDRLGLTAERLQELRFAAEQNGIAARTLDLGMQRLTRRLGEAAQGGGELAGTLRQYGIAVRDAQGRTRSTAAVLGDLADRIQGAGSQQERLRIAFKAFDSEGAGMVNILRDGRAGLEEWTRKAQNAGVVMDEELVDRAREVNRVWETMTRRIGVEAKGAVIAFVGAIQDLFSPPSAESLMDTLTSDIGEADSRAANLQRRIDNLLDRGVSRDSTSVRVLSRDLAAARQEAESLEGMLRLLRTEARGPFQPPVESEPVLSQQAQDTIEALRFQEEQMTRTTAVQRVYNEVRRAGVAVDSAAGLEIRNLVERIQEAERAQEAATERTREIEQVFEATRTPLERYNAEVERLNRLFNDGKDQTNLYNRAIEQAQDRLRDATRETDHLARAMESGLDAALDGNIRSWRDLGRVALDVLGDVLRDIIRVQTQAQGGLGSSVLGAIGQVFGIGGVGTPPIAGGSTGVGTLTGANGVSAMVGGVGGTDSQRVMVHATPGERIDVLTPAQQRRHGGGGTVVINQTFQVPADRTRDAKFLAGFAAQIREETKADVIALIDQGRL